MSQVRDVISLFGKGFNCAQSLLAVYGKIFGVEAEMALKITAALGGGMGKTGETCGAVTGALLLIGLRYGSADAQHKIASAKTCMIAQKFIREFTLRNHSVECRNLVGFDFNQSHGTSLNSEKIIMKQCPKYVQDAAEILEEIL